MSEDKVEESVSNENSEIKRHRGELIPGTILIVLGILFLLPKLGINFGNLWPTFILAPGLAFFVFYIFNADKRKNAGILIPATIVSLIAIFFFVLNFTTWDYMDKLWPLFPLIISIAFYAAYFAGIAKRHSLLLPANILAVIGIVFLFVNFLSVNLWPLILIAAGLFFIIFPHPAKERD